MNFYNNFEGNSGTTTGVSAQQHQHLPHQSHHRRLNSQGSSSAASSPVSSVVQSPKSSLVSWSPYGLFFSHLPDGSGSASTPATSVATTPKHQVHEEEDEVVEEGEDEGGRSPSASLVGRGGGVGGAPLDYTFQKLNSSDKGMMMMRQGRRTTTEIILGYETVPHPRMDEDDDEDDDGGEY